MSGLRPESGARHASVAADNLSIFMSPPARNNFSVFFVIFTMSLASSDYRLISFTPPQPDVGESVARKIDQRL
jgi:hypothetical protein